MTVRNGRKSRRDRCAFAEDLPIDVARNTLIVGQRGVYWVHDDR
jgi:hypothetical protein